MKKALSLLLAASAAVLAFSCQKEIPSAIREDDTRSQETGLVFKATISETKVGAGATGQLSWQSTDKIVVYALNGSTSLGSVELAPTRIDGGTAYFTTDALPATATSFAAYIKGSGISGLTVKSGVPGFSTESNFGTSGIPTMSCAVCTPDNLTLAFHNMSCLVKVSTTRTNVAYVAIQGLNGESIGQTGFIAPDGTYSKVSDATYMTVSVKQFAAAVAGAPGTYYIALPPGINFTKGFKVLLQDSSVLNTLASFEYPIPVTTVSNKMFNFGDFDSADKDKVKEKYWEYLIKKAGKDPADYYRMKFNISPYSFFNSTGSEGWKLQSAIMSGSTHEYLPKYCTTQVFSKAELPNGTLLLQMPGSTYRPEGWQTLGQTATGTRPGEISTACVEVNDSWWGAYTYRAFNLYYTSPALTFEQMCEIPTNFAIFIPKSAVSSSSVLGILKDAGYDPDKYDQIMVKVFQKAYWNSQANGQTDYLAAYWADTINSSPASAYYPQLLPYPVRKDQGSSLKNYATEVFPKASLPNGTVIVSKSDFSYRPEAWTSMKTYTSNRPAVVTSNVTVVNDSWWGSFNFRAFNISAVTISQGSYFGNAQGEQVRASFAIFVPKEQNVE